jgi:hypothetical protein
MAYTGPILTNISAQKGCSGERQRRDGRQQREGAALFGESMGAVLFRGKVSWHRNCTVIGIL